LAFHRQVPEKGVDFDGAHFQRVPFVVEDNEALGPIVVGVFGANAHVADAASMAKAIEQFGGWGFHAE